MSAKPRRRARVTPAIAAVVIASSLLLAAGAGRLGGSAGAGPRATIAAASIDRGRFIVLRACAACHAVGSLGSSPDASAPPFRTVARREDPAALRAALAEISRRGHRQMPPVAMTAEEIGDMAAYIDDLRPAMALPATRPAVP